MSSSARRRQRGGSAAVMRPLEAEESIDSNSRHQMSALGAGMIEAVGSMSSTSPDSRISFMENECIVEI